MPVGAPPRMLLAGGQGSKLRGVSSDPHLRNGGLSPAGPGARPSTVAGAMGHGGQRRVEELGGTVRPAAREDVSVQALRLTLRSMADHPHMPLVQEYGCGTLYNLALSNPQTTRMLLHSEGGVPLVLAAMKEHIHSAGTLLNACSLLKELAEFQPCLQQLDAGGARKLLLEVADKHQLHAELSARVEEALKYLPESHT